LTPPLADEKHAMTRSHFVMPTSSDGSPLSRTAPRSDNAKVGLIMLMPTSA
jgi:hypothetical protein